MRSFNDYSSVVLPNWLLEKEQLLPEHLFLDQVRKYLTRYPDYKLLKVKDGFAVCERLKGG